MYARQAEGKTYTFGVSGSLWRDALVMYDRETNSLWSQINGESILGDETGAKLERIPSRVMSWGEWRRLHPDSLVLEKPDGPTPNEYARYASDPDKMGIFGTRNSDKRLGGKDWVMGISEGTSSVAFPHAALERAGFATADLGGKTVVAAFNRAGGSTVAWSAEVDGRRLVFPRSGGNPRSARDEETGSTWDLIRGEAVAGPLRGRKLQQIAGVDAYWFAWSSFYPRTEIWKGGAN